MTQHHYADSGTTKGTAVATFAPGPPMGMNVATPGTCVALSFVKYNPETGHCAMPHHWGAPLEQGPVLWEKPQIYPTVFKRRAQEIAALANDAIDLTDHGRSAAAFMAGPWPVTSAQPRVWKKQVPKPQHHWAAWVKYLHESERRLLAEAYGGTFEALGAYILAACEAYARNGKITGYSSRVTDLLDALCLGLWDTGRFRV